MEAFVPPNYCYILKSNKMKIELKTVLSLGSVRWKMTKKTMFMRLGNWKVRRSNATPIIF